jgi:nitrite reductase/ring-hydroxylating ferredoxin subunit
MTELYLCKLNELPNFEARGFTVDSEHGELSLVAIHHDNEISVYENRCPHLNIPLNWQPDEFMSLEGTHIQCSTHGALFNIEDGHCISGPCRGQGLSRYKATQKDDEVWLKLS